MSNVTRLCPEAGPHHFARLARNAKPPQWCVQDFLVEGGLVTLAGRAKVAKKTWIGLHVAHAVASGAKVFGRFTAYRRPVHFVALEGGLDRLAWRLRLLGVPQGASDMELPAYGWVGMEGFELLAALLVKVTSPALIVLDPLANLASARELSENSAEDMTRLLDSLYGLVKGSRSTLLLIHHFNKGGEAMRGSTAIEANSDGWIESRPAQGHDDAVCLAVTLRDAPSFEVGVRVRAGDPFVVEAVDGLKRRGADVERDADAVLAFMLGNPDMLPGGYRKIHAAMKAGGSGISEARVQDALGRLKGDGKVEYRPSKGYIVERIFLESLNATNNEIGILGL